MTDNLSHDLALLADEVDPAPIDTYDVIKKARARTRNRRAGLATAISVVAVASAAVATFGAGGPAPITVGTSATTTTAPPTSPGVPDKVCGGNDLPIGVCGEAETFGPDARSLALDTQLRPVADDVVWSRFQQDKMDYPMFANVEVLQFVPTSSDAEPVYVANALIWRADAQAELTITVLKRPAGSTLGQVEGRPLAPCQDKVGGCEWRQLEDGTVAAALADGTPPGMLRSSSLTVQRPDGTYVEVFANPLPDADSPVPPFSNEELFRFATVFTY